MSRKELPRPGLVAAALAGRISNREGARALRLTIRQFQRLKQRVRTGGAGTLRHQSRGRPSRQRVPAAVAAQVQALMRSPRRLQRHPSHREAARAPRGVSGREGR